MPISTIADATSLFICRDMPVTKVRDGWEVNGQVLSGKQLVDLARQLDGGDAKPGKYGNRKTVVDGIAFDSKAEANEYQRLRALEQAGAISELECQPRFEIVPAFRDATGTRHAPRRYTADFQYKEAGRIVVVEIKGFKSEAYVLRRTLFLYHYSHLIFKEIEV